MEVQKQIGIFTLDSSESTMKYGLHYYTKMDVPFDSEKRTIRVWLPEDYDFSSEEKRFPVIYFSDGQNLVNKYLTAFGDWGLDKVAHELLMNKNISFIAVGIDSPNDDNKRANELNPPFIPDKAKGFDNPRADIFTDFIVNKLKPLIDDLFYTKKDKENTAIGGSSMGGIMAFYGAIRHKETFGFSLDFSPAFFLYSKRKWKALLDSFDISPTNGVKFYFYVGGKGFEHLFIRLTKYTYNYLIEKGFNDRETFYIQDEKEKHHEDAWHKYLGDAVAFWLLKNE